MRTILTKEIDGYEIITGINKPAIDAVATNKAIAKLCTETDESKAVDTKLNECKKMAEIRTQLITQINTAIKNKDVLTQAKSMNELSLRNEQLNALNEELKELISAKVKKDKEIFSKNAVYFEPKKGEKIINDVEAYEISEKITNLKKNEKITSDGEIITDNRGVKYVKVGKIYTVEKLGDKPDGPLFKDLTLDEFEKMRFDNLSIEEKESEKNAIIEGLANQATIMRSKLEIKGVTNALEQSQEWYKTESAKIEKKYK